VWSGLWLLLSPWTALWDQNLFARIVPALGVVMANPFVRGAVTGVGVVTIGAGIRELFEVFASRTPPEPPPDVPTDRPPDRPRTLAPDASRQ
jgi:hypothetical protein